MFFSKREREMGDECSHLIFYFFPIFFFLTLIQFSNKHSLHTDCIYSSKLNMFVTTKGFGVMCEGVSLTGISKGQSSARHSLVTQWRKTVDIFWFLCFTKRNTSKAKRPIWLFPFSKTVVWGSFSQLLTKRISKGKKRTE